MGDDFFKLLEMQSWDSADSLLKGADILGWKVENEKSVKGYTIHYSINVRGKDYSLAKGIF